MKYNLSYLLFLSLIFHLSCNQEPSGTNQLTKDQLRHLPGIDVSYLYSTPETFDKEFTYVENGVAIINLTVKSTTNEEKDTKYRPQDRINVTGDSKIDLNGKSILTEASTSMKGDSNVPQAELMIKSTIDSLLFYCNLNGLYNLPYSQYMPLEEVVIHNVQYRNVYVFNAEKALQLGFEFSGFKEVCYAKDYGFIKIELDPTHENVPADYKLELLTYFKIEGLDGPISSTGVVAYYYDGAAENAPLLSNQGLYEVINYKDLSDEQKLWNLEFRSENNALRSAFAGGEVQWDAYLATILALNDSLVKVYELSYQEVSQQVSSLSGSSATPNALSDNDSLSLGAFKWNIFYRSHVNTKNESESLATKTGEPFATGDSLSIHGDLENLLGFELSNPIQRGKYELTTPKGKEYGDPQDVLKLLVIDNENSTQNGGQYKNRVFLLDPRFTQIGSYADRDNGVAVLRTLDN